MTFKEILKEWWNNVKAFSTISWKAIVELFTTSFNIIKDPIVIFLKALWAWLKAIFKGLYKIVKSFLLDLVTATIKFIYKSFICFCKWIISLFKKKPVVKEAKTTKNKKK